MPDLSQSIQQINSDYYAIVSSGFTSEELTALTHLETNDLRDFILRGMSGPRLTFPGYRHSASALEYRIMRVILDVADFWERRGATLYRDLSNSGWYSILLPSTIFIEKLVSHISRLGVYFDTTVLVDPLHIPSPQTRQWLRIEQPNITRANKLILCEKLARILRIRRIAEAGLCPPLVTIVPAFLQSDTTTSTIDADSIIRGMLSATGSGLPEDNLPKFLRNIEDSRLEKLIVDKELLQELRHRFEKPHEKVWRCDTETGEWDCTERGFQDHSLSGLVMTLWNYLCESISNFHESCIVADKSNSDPIVFNGNLPFFRKLLHPIPWHPNESAPIRFEEQAVASALISEEVSFLEALSLDDLASMRAHNQLEELRRILRLERQELRAKSLDKSNLERAARIFTGKMIASVRDFGEAIAKERATQNKSMKRSIAGLAGSGAIGVAGLMNPVLGVIGMAVGMLSSKSIMDVASQRQNAVRALSSMERSPLGIIYGAYVNASGQLQR